jgi:hypothetical protein
MVNTAHYSICYQIGKVFSQKPSPPNITVKGIDSVLPYNHLLSIVKLGRAYSFDSVATALRVNTQNGEGPVLRVTFSILVIHSNNSVKYFFLGVGIFMVLRISKK